MSNGHYPPSHQGTGGGYPPQAGPGGYPPHGAPGSHGGPPPGGGWGPPPARSNSGPIIAVIVLLVVAIGVVLTLWQTGVFGGGSSSTRSSDTVNISVNSPSNTSYSGNMSYTPPANSVTPSYPATTAGIDNAYLSGRWCDTTGGWMSFDTASSQINLPAGNTGQRVVGTYSLAGSSLSIVGPSGARISASLTRIDDQTMSMSIMGRPERVTRC
jgi:hypothetical protein